MWQPAPPLAGATWSPLEVRVKLHFWLLRQEDILFNEGTEVTSLAQGHAARQSFLEPGQKCWSFDLRILGTVACSQGLLQ